MKFSILVAHYNNFEYFKDCYKSIIEQSVQDFEVIIVDDCSTDGSFEKLKDWVKNDSRVKVFRNEENKGVGYTKKKCIELATGDICGFLDPDDAIAEDALEETIKNFSEDIVAIYSKINICDEKLNPIRFLSRQKQISNNQKEFLNINFEVSHFFVFRRSEYLRTEGINPELRSVVDQDLYLKMYERGAFKFLPKSYYFYRMHSRGISQEKNKKEILRCNWHKVLKNTLERRNITQIYGKKVSEIKNLPKFVFEKENTFFKRVIRKFL